MVDYVGAWDCHYCGSKKIWGYDRACPSCGRPRANDTKFYRPDDAPEITQEMKKVFDGGADWYCEHCDTGNKGNTGKCENCGASRGKSKQHQVRSYLDRAPKSEDETANMEASSTLEPQVDYVAPDDPYDPPISNVSSHEISKVVELEPKRNWLKIGLISFAVVAVAFLSYLFFFKTHDVPATVSSFSWSQTVHIEEYQTFHEEGWNVPLGARLTSQEIRQSGWVTVTDGYRTETYSDTCYRSVYVSRTCERDNGNGSFSTYECGGNESESYSCTNTREVPITHEEPVYATWYFYDIDRWVIISDHPTSGIDHDPYYDPVSSNGSLQRRVEVPGQYTVYFSCPELKDFSKDYDLDTWKTFDYGQEHMVTTNIFKTILKVR